MIQIMVMQEELNDEFVHSRAFGERQGFAHQTPEALAQGVVETLDVVGSDCSHAPAREQSNSDYPRTLASRGTNLKIEYFVLNLNQA
jgi:hypothetical protein